jgi:hypothetical protein
MRARIGRRALSGALAAALLALLLPQALAAQEASEGSFVIRSLDFRVEGRTRASALRRLLEASGPVVGRSFSDRASLDAYAAECAKALLDNRVIASAEPSLELTSAEGGGSDAALSFAVADTRNRIAFPKPGYDSNTGLSLYLKGRDYDFMGSMQTLELDLGYQGEAANNGYFEAMADFFLPIGADWNLGFYEDAQVRTRGTAKSDSAASLSYDLPGLGFPLRLKGIADLSYDGDSLASDPWYLSGIAAASAAVPLGFSLGPWGEASFLSNLSLTANWWPDTSLSYPYRQGEAPAFYAGLRAGRIGWEGNFQAGGAVSLNAEGSYFATRQDSAADLELKLEEHWQWAKRIGISARLIALDRLVGSPDMTDLGDYLAMNVLGQYLRGVPDSSARGVAGAFVNLSAPIKLFDFPTHAIIKTDALDFELQAAPFVDAAVIESDRALSFDSSWLRYTGGIELLVFPKAFRSFILRASIGWDLSSSSHPHEIFIGTQLMTDPILTPYVTWVEN